MASPSLHHPIVILLLFFLFLVQSNLSTSTPAIQLPNSHQHSPVTLFVNDFGAVGDGVHYETDAIQSAVNACPSTISTPCYVTFLPGNYLTATVRLKSNVILDIRENATVLGGTRIDDYPRKSSEWYVILAENATDVGITGGGVVDGQGLKFVVRKNERKNVMVSWNQTGACLGDECRPRLVGFLGCKNVRVWNVNLREPAYWWSVHSP